MTPTYRTFPADAADAAYAWLTGSALPIWLDRGWDGEHGGFYDKLDQRGNPIDADKRVRVQARQIFCYAQAGALGWQGPWHEAVGAGLTFMRDAYRRDDGLYRRSVTRHGAPADETIDLYDQAFVLFALASARAVLPDNEALRVEALALLARLDDVAAHPDGGYREIGVADGLLRSNPHMHLLEALLAWSAIDADTTFADRAQAIVDLALARFIDPSTGAVAEYFDQRWALAAGIDGNIREPGHQFEWAYLLGEADRLLGGDHRIASDRLYRFGSTFGVREGRTIFSTGSQGLAIDETSRLWAQTERLRAALVRLSAGDADPEDARSAAMQSFDWTWRLLDVPVAGLWRDRTTAAGETIDEPAPASSFYHLMTGFLPLLQYRRAA